MDLKTFLENDKPLENLPIAEFIKRKGIADEFMKERYEKIKINQLRNFFSEIKTMEKMDEKDLPTSKARLEMNLAYDFGRNVIDNDFYNLTTELINRIQNLKDFEVFVQMVKALIAFHKYHTQKKL